MTQASPAVDSLPPYVGLTRPEPTLPGSWYFDPAHHLREMADIWCREWLCVGRAEGVRHDFSRQSARRPPFKCPLQMLPNPDY
jgi:hypothetical protein